MAQLFSDETRDLFERAERAIQRSIRLRQLFAEQLKNANRFLLELQAHRSPNSSPSEEEGRLG